MIPKDSSGVFVPPPAIYLIFLIAGYSLHHFWPLPFLPSGLKATAPVAGFAVMGLGFLLLALAEREFLKHRTSHNTAKPTTTIITTGPFRYSRNPVYLGLTLLCTGLAIKADSIWLLGLITMACLVIHHFVVLKEEAYLERKFGEVYLRYKSSVRRWL